MYIIAGYRTTLWNDIWGGTYICSQCNQVSDFHLKRIKRVGTIFFIPFIFVTAGYLMVCDHCGAILQIKRPEYKKLKKSQELKLHNNQFPLYIIQNDYNPKALKLTLKKVLLILSIIFTVISFGIGAFVLIPTLISFIRAYKKYSVYKKTIMSNNQQNFY